MEPQVSYRHQPSTQYSHVEWIELYSDGILHECAVLKRNQDGSILFFRINDLDDIDKRRLVGILVDRNARNFELWDLMSQKTLGNGMNALEYFHQLVKVLATNGKVIDLRGGQASGAVQTAPQVVQAAA